MKNFKLRAYLFAFVLMIAPVVQADTEMLKSGVASYKKGDYSTAATSFYKLTNMAGLSDEMLAQSNYYLGLSLYKLKLYQASSYPIIKAVKSNSKKFRQKALIKLVQVSNRLGSQRMLDIAISELKPEDLANMAADIYYYKLASVNYEKNNIDKAIADLNTALMKNPNNEPSLNLLAISYLRKNETDKAIETYTKLLSTYKAGDTGAQKSYTLLNLARAYFQAKKFDKAIEYYSQIPKTSAAFRESLTELAWSYLHKGKLQTAVGVLQTLHSPYYENYYDPESMFLRAILLNYTCQLDEAEAVIKSFNTNYVNILEILENWTDQPVDVTRTMVEVDYASEVLRSERKNRKYHSGLMRDYNGKIPFKVTRSVLRDNRMKNVYESLETVKGELDLARKTFKDDKLELKPFLEKIYGGRVDYFKQQLASTFHKLLLDTAANLSYYKDQFSFVNYEIFETKKVLLKQKIQTQKGAAASDNLEIKKTVAQSRGAYESAGMVYWPFKGEYWKDEIGNYQYFGENFCVQE